MKAPKKKNLGVNIAGLEYEIVVKHDVVDENGNPCHGLLDTQAQKLYLDAGGTKERREITFIHEVLHGIEDACGLQLTEGQIDGLSRHLWLAGFRL